MFNIPIYRGKKIDSDEYVEGSLIEDYGMGHFIQINKWIEKVYSDFSDEVGYCTTDFIRIDPKTLAIHFPNMIDSQGNKIFASLDSVDGIGGDVIKTTNEDNMIGIAMWDINRITIKRKNMAQDISMLSTDLEIIGIKNA